MFFPFVKQADSMRHKQTSSDWRKRDVSILLQFELEAVPDGIGVELHPVAENHQASVVGNGFVDHQMQVTEEEETRVRIRQKICFREGFERFDIARLCGRESLGGESALTAAEGPATGKAERPSRVDGGVKDLAQAVTEDTLNKAIFEWLITDFIAVREEETFAEQLRIERLAVYDGSDFLRQVVEHPDVVIADKEMDFDTEVAQLGDLTEKAHVSARHDVFVFVPIVEDIAQEIHGRRIVFNLVEPSDETFLCGHRVV